MCGVVVAVIGIDGDIDGRRAIPVRGLLEMQAIQKGVDGRQIALRGKLRAGNAAVNQLPLHAVTVTTASSAVSAPP